MKTASLCVFGIVALALTGCLDRSGLEFQLDAGSERAEEAQKADSVGDPLPDLSRAPLADVAPDNILAEEAAHADFAPESGRDLAPDLAAIYADASESVKETLEPILDAIALADAATDTVDAVKPLLPDVPSDGRRVIADARDARDARDVRDVRDVRQERIRDLTSVLLEEQ